MGWNFTVYVLRNTASYKPVRSTSTNQYYSIEGGSFQSAYHTVEDLGNFARDVGSVDLDPSPFDIFLRAKLPSGGHTVVDLNIDIVNCEGIFVFLRSSMSPIALDQHMSSSFLKGPGVDLLTVIAFWPISSCGILRCGSDPLYIWQ